MSRRRDHPDSKIEIMKKHYDVEREVFGDLLAKRRYDLGLTRKQMAELIDVDSSITIWRWETGRTLPRDPYTLAAIARCYGLNKQDRDKLHEAAFGKAIISANTGLLKPLYPRISDYMIAISNGVMIIGYGNEKDLFAVLSKLTSVIERIRTSKEFNCFTKLIDKKYEDKYELALGVVILSTENILLRKKTYLDVFESYIIAHRKFCDDNVKPYEGAPIDLKSLDIDNTGVPQLSDEERNGLVSIYTIEIVWEVGYVKL